ncbi:hypothetical protein [Streptomyces sp. SM12]|uniref:hypothetical protein n=1 Tax=Streptomyces sp. SM12 TaxID=1071602 RepID=UPI000CD53F5F|nr:hypothetical protein [Streptomyces sp. SM12]
MTAKINGSAPDGYAMPAGARKLLDAAEHAGWGTVYRWGSDFSDDPFVEILVGIPATGEKIRGTWHSRDLPPGRMRMTHLHYEPFAGHVGQWGWTLKRAIDHVLNNTVEESE